MKVSIIIPTYNEEDVIQDCLRSLSKQSFKDFDVIVVDDGSTDRTHEVTQKLKSTNSNFQIKTIKTKHLGAGGARNTGAKYAKGDILVFVDADMTFDINFLQKLTEPIRKHFSKGTFSKDEYVSNWENIWAKCWNINENWESKKRHPKNYPDEQSVFRAILKTEFDKVDGFTAGGYNDDWSLSQKLGYKAEVAPKAIFFHKNPDSLKEVFTHAKWVGKREYKLGLIGYIAGLARSSFPASLIIGLVKSFFTGVPMFLVFKVVYDAGIFVGIINYIFTKEGSK